MSSHYIHLRCPATDCGNTGLLYTGSTEVDGFEDAADYEGETIYARCDDHADWTRTEGATR